jgi:hypothetical protein
MKPPLPSEELGSPERLPFLFAQKMTIGAVSATLDYDAEESWQDDPQKPEIRTLRSHDFVQNIFSIQ